MKHGKYVTGSVAGLELSRERMCEKVSFRLFPVLFQGGDKDAAEIQVGCRRGGGLEHSSDTMETRGEGDCEPFNVAGDSRSFSLPRASKQHQCNNTGRT